MPTPKSPTVLIIIDGFGHGDSDRYNAVTAAEAPVWQNLWQNNPKTLKPQNPKTPKPQISEK